MPARLALPCLIALCAAAPLWADSVATLPITGEPVESLASFDAAITQYMTERSITAGTLAISRDGRIIYQRGYGWRDQAKTQPTPPDTVMRIASVSKPITAAAVRRLISGRKLKPGDLAFKFVQCEVPADIQPDPRLKSITITHLLEHRGGWDRSAGFDPMFHDREIMPALGLNQPATSDEIIRYMMGQPLNFDPGERNAYSNFGYCVLGRVVETAGGEPYIDLVQRHIAKPLKMTSLRLGRTNAADRLPDEVEYPIKDGSLQVERMDAHGGLVCSAADLCRFMDSYWLNGEPRREGDRGDFVFFGAMRGTSSMARQRRDGIHIAVLFNNWPKDANTIKQTLDGIADQVTQWPQP